MSWSLEVLHPKFAWTFEGCEKANHDLRILFLRTLFEWVLLSFDSLLDLIDHCSPSL
jgi:hypothetical protein